MSNQSFSLKFHIGLFALDAAKTGICHKPVPKTLAKQPININLRPKTNPLVDALLLQDILEFSNGSMTSPNFKSIEGAYRFSVAPMLDCTDRHFRVLMRQISRRALLYTEMIVAQSLHYSKSINKLLDFDPLEHPIALQIGGNDPELLAYATKLASEWGYDEINLNIGCPSQKVQDGNFGACLMAKPDLVANCVEAMKQASKLPVTVKHRIGIDDLDNDDLLTKFVDKLANAGANRFSVHARKAYLKGLDPKQNRTIPPLQHDRVLMLKKRRPELLIELNGGLNSPQDCLKALNYCDGAMVGRAAYSHPLRWITIDSDIFGEKTNNTKASDVINGLIPYTAKHLEQGGRLWDICRHTIQLVKGVSGAKKWRNNFCKLAQNPNANINILINAGRQLKDAGL